LNQVHEQSIVKITDMNSTHEINKNEGGIADPNART
jgi:hypothetical protein